MCNHQTKFKLNNNNNKKEDFTKYVHKELTKTLTVNNFCYADREIQK